ncbi:E3 ubiquitin-protein ligase CHIP-like isoform X2 [Mucor ambiguus]|uniref:E3 ubiquitin-protein ligase CHIP n=1 Tax=Mucor ambiguus TaxID=91626 RepID=A0A0C9N1K4_9FUNG|nr:E3 ubiquitin-protein ligase CHIP-like isoform X2 [Mucor ambiguus]
MSKAEAENHKANERRYEDAIKEYTSAIIKDFSVGVYYTNRALCYSKLEQYDNVITDCRKAIEIDPTLVKAYYLVGQALTEKKQHTEALKKLKTGYELAIQQKVKYVNDILQALLIARKRKWEDDEAIRLEKENELLRYVKSLIEQDRAQQLAAVDPNDEEAIDTINYNIDERLSKVQHVFVQSKDNASRREIPDAYLDKISFNIMHDPVFTPDGITYERQSLLDHFKRNGYFDPISRRPCTEKQLVPNLSLREAIEDFLKDNGWAAGMLSCIKPGGI